MSIPASILGRLLAADPPDEVDTTAYRAPAARPRKVVPLPAADQSIVQQIRIGDRSAFATLYREFHPRLLSLAYAVLRNTSIAEEIVQDVFLELWERRAQWTVRQTVAVYLYGAVRNRAISQLRRNDAAERWTVRAGESDLDTVVPSPNSADVALDLAERERAVRAAIRALPERVRTMLQLRWDAELTYPEIAAILGTSDDAVRKQLGRTIAQLRTVLQPFAPDS